MTFGRYLWMDALASCLPRAPRGTSILVLSPGHLGDILHAVPMLQALRAGRPDARIAWWVGPWSEPLARRYGHLVDDLGVFGPALPEYTRGSAAWRQGAWTQWRMAMNQRRAGVDVLIGAMNGTGRFLANALRPARWIGIGDRRPPRVRAEIDTVVQPYEKDRFEADAWCGLLLPLGIRAQADRLTYEVTKDEQFAADAFLAAEGAGRSRPLAVIAPGSGWSGKNWMPERFGQVADWLVRDKGFQVAWVGTAGEQDLIPSGRAGDLNWMGRTSLPLLAALMGPAGIFIGNDSGLLHLAAAVDVPTVSVWGPTRPGKWGPRGPRHRQIRKVEHCDGCLYWDWRETCRHDHACMQAVGVDEVLRAAESALGPSG
jgi:heptosyltransferase I